MVEEQLRASKEEMERCLSEYDELFRTIQRLSEELNSQITANGVLQASAIPSHAPEVPMIAHGLMSCAVALRGSGTGGVQALFWSADKPLVVVGSATAFSRPCHA